MSRYRKLTTICAAVVLSLGLAACGGGGGGTSGGPPAGPDPALGAAQTAAATAAAEAGKAATAAETAADGQTMNKDADPANYALAQDSATRARAAANAAEAASNAAAATDVTATAQAQQAIAEAKQVEAEAEEDSAVKYAGMVQTAHQDDLDEEQRVKDVASARGKAMQSYMDADADATKAEGQADAAEATAPGTAGAMAARTAATAARTAATNAKAAHDAITDGMTKAQADAKASEAAGEASTASTQYMAAKKENDTIQTAHTIGEEQRRVQAIADARSFGGAAVTNAKKAADDAQDAADAAKDAADDANAAYMAAMNGRTDATEAKKHADAADAAHTKAQAAANDAMAAYNAAKAAIDGVTDGSTTDQANTARMEAENQEGIADGHKATAMTQQTAAEGSETKAVAAAGVHVLEFLMAANVAEVTDDPKTKADENLAEVKKVAASIGGAAGSLSDGDNDSTTTDGSRSVGAIGAVTATVAWPANTPANPDADPPTKEVPMYRTVTITGVQGDSIVSVIDKQQNDANNDGDYDDGGDTKANASVITGLPGFSFGLDIMDGERRAIVFTDKKQATAQVKAKTVTVRNLAVSMGRIVVNKDADPNPGSGNDLSGNDLSTTTKYDHDGLSSTLPIVGTYTCLTGTNCSITVVDKKVTAIAGSVLFSAVPDTLDDTTGVPANGQGIIKAAAAPNTMNDYLAFGVWIDEDGGTDDGRQPELGAFVGGQDPVTGNIQAVTGTATYKGAATGVYTQGSSVDYFQATATLSADFDKLDAGETTDDDLGTVTGRIDGIVAGGMSKSDVIHLWGATGEKTAITSSATFSGMARMGTRKVDGSSVTYPYNGSWNGRFYNPAKTTDGQSDLTKQPGSAAGTFGVTGEVGEGDDAVTTSYVGAFGAHKQ